MLLYFIRHSHDLMLQSDKFIQRIFKNEFFDNQRVLRVIINLFFIRFIKFGYIWNFHQYYIMANLQNSIHIQFVTIKKFNTK